MKLLSFIFNVLSELSHFARKTFTEGVFYGLMCTIPYHMRGEFLFIGLPTIPWTHRWLIKIATTVYCEVGIPGYRIRALCVDK